MSQAAADTGILSREELDALLSEMPGLLDGRDVDEEGTSSRESQLELERIHQAFALEYGRALANRHERALSLVLIGQREIESRELAELMLPTDVVGSFQIQPKGCAGYILLSRPFFFQMLCLLFGAAPGLKTIRPPTRDYTRVERRFYTRVAKEMIAKLEEQWQKEAATVSLVWNGILPRVAIGEGDTRSTWLATFDVKGFGETCRVRIAIPAEVLRRPGASPSRVSKPVPSGGPSLLEVPIRLRAQVGTAELSLGEVGRLAVGQTIALDVPSDGTLTVRIGEQEKFRGIAGTRGAKRAVQLQERIEGAE